MHVSLTYLRANLYEIVDAVIAKGVPVEVMRKGQKVRITVVKKQDIFAIPRKYPKALIGDSSDLAHIHWDKEWNEEENF